MWSGKLLWTGLTFLLAVPAALKIFGLSVNQEVVVGIGAAAMFFGLVLFWLDK